MDLKHIHKVNFYPSGNNFTQALLVMLVTNIISEEEEEDKEERKPYLMVMMMTMKMNEVDFPAVVFSYL